MNNRTATGFLKAVFPCFLLLCLAVLLFLPNGKLGAQGTGRIKHVITQSSKQFSPPLGRDLWFTMAENYENQGGKTYYLYVTSENPTTINVEVVGFATIQAKIRMPGEVKTIVLPLAWEVTTSGVVEDKGIHVWSKDADISAYLLSYNPYTTDGMYIIPAIGWGTHYVVAAFDALFEGFGQNYDYPSEFSVIANQDNTTVTITPSIDLRGVGDPVLPAHRKNIPFQERLMKGQCVQYKGVYADNVGFDLTGSVVDADKPVGVVGASQCPNIPQGYPYCDHVCDMLEPTRTWATTYYTIPFKNRKDGDTFLGIASADGQKIYKSDATGTGRLWATLNKGEYFWDNEVTLPTKWYSDSAFSLVQYINSATWPDHNDGFGDPAMVVVNAVEEYTPKLVFQVPAIGNGGGYQHYVNVICRADQENNTTFNGSKIGTFGNRIAIDNVYEGFRIGPISPGTYVVKSDSGVGVYIYGYGHDESYAWSGGLGTKTFNSPDTLPPFAKTLGSCFEAQVNLYDNRTTDSKLYDIRLDSSNNMNYTIDPNWQEGLPTDTSFYLISVADSTLPAYTSVTGYDQAGNRVNIYSTYTPNFAVLSPKFIDYGIGTKGQTTDKYFTLHNSGSSDFKFNTLKLLYGNQGFSIDSAVDNSPIHPGETRKIRVGFNPIGGQNAFDTLIFGDECFLDSGAVRGNGGQADFTVTDDDFGQVLIPKTVKNQSIEIDNNSPVNVTITQITTDNPAFIYDPTTPAINNLPFVVKPGERRHIEMQFNASVVGLKTGHGHFVSQEAGAKDDKLKGVGIESETIFVHDIDTTSDCGAIDTLRFLIQATGPLGANSVISKVDHTAGADPVLKNIFTGFKVTDASGNLVTTYPYTLRSQDYLYVTEYFTPTPGLSGTFTDLISASGVDGSVFKTITLNVKSTFRSYSVPTLNLNFPLAPYGGPVSAPQYFDINNTALDDLQVRDVVPQVGPTSLAFRIASVTVGGTPVTFPVVLKAGQVLHVGVTFDPSKYSSSLQQATFDIQTNSCVNQETFVGVQGIVSIGGASIAGYNPPLISSCSNRLDNVVVSNTAPIGDVISAITITGPDKGNFSTTIKNGDSVRALKSLNVPVLFSPAGQIAGKTYNATVTITLHNDRKDTTLVQTISSSATGIQAAVSSQFASNNLSAAPNATVSLPIAITVNKNGLADPLANSNIQRIVLTYNYNTDVLDIPGTDVVASQGAAIKSALSNLPAGWTVDPASKVVGNTLTLILTGPSLADNVSTLGTINFRVTLPKTDNDNVVRLQTASFQNSQGQDLSSCVAATTDSTNFSLIYQCPDSLLQGVMNNRAMLNFAGPAKPNPVGRTSNVLTIGYGTRLTIPISLIAYDLLGNPVAHLLDKVVHSPGVYEVKFNTSALPSGTYTLRLQGERAVVSQQVVVEH